MYEYCLLCRDYPADNIHRIHHDSIYGLALDNDNALFGRLLLEINQAGLSWDTILKKEDNFKKAYSDYSIEHIANYSEKDKSRLLNDKGIIRNRLKIEAAIFNAQKVIELQSEFGSFFRWIKIQESSNINEWVKLFKNNFKFTGGEIVNEFLMTIGRTDGAHHEDCPIYSRYIESRKLWDPVS